MFFYFCGLIFARFRSSHSNIIKYMFVGCLILLEGCFSTEIWQAYIKYAKEGIKLSCDLYTKQILTICELVEIVYGIVINNSNNNVNVI